MLKRILILTLFLTAPLIGQLTPTLKQTNRYSVRELEDWLKKQNRPNYVIPAVYAILGQVSSKWTHVYENLGGQDQLELSNSLSNNQFNLSTELQFNYALGRTFTNTRLKFSNAAGTFKGSANSISLPRAFIGYHFVTYGPHTLDAILGRRDLTKMYNSQMMFKSSGDGLTLMGFYVWKKVVEYQITGGLYSSNPGSFWIIRGRLFNIANLGFYIDYDFIWWGTVKPSSNITNIPTKYGVSQFLVGWNRTPAWLGTNIQIFAALIYNGRAQAHALSDNKLLNLAGYVGAQYGTIKNAGDFSIQGQLQFCELQAIPEWDFAGIGRGNAAKGSLYKATSLSAVNSNTNYQGYLIKLNYALTSKLTLTADFQRSVNLNDGVGLPSNYRTFSLSTAYSF
ncbi:MAG: hypothetical protein S4CHLAM7_10820 [Chlamydiae bacterium]|nr:hypothetical protein [Chlamydiota bacterium]